MAMKVQSKGIAAIYVRVSTTKETQKDSPEHQLMFCQEKARMEGLSVQFIYEDRDSATSINAREEIQRLVGDAKKGYFDTVIFASLSRFSRDQLDSLTLKRKLVDALGIRLISLDEAYDSAVDKEDELKFQVISAVNQKLSQQISIASRRGIRQSAKKGNFTGSIAPFGYVKEQIEVNGKTKKTLVIDKEKAKIVRLIFHLYVNEKMGEKAIVNFLNEENIQSPKDGVWGITSVQRILQNEAYTGFNVFNKYELKKIYHNLDDMTDRGKKLVQKDKGSWEKNEEKDWEAIIAVTLYEKAQKIRLERGGGARGGVRNKVNPFIGLVFCRHCGSSMISTPSKNGKKKNGEKQLYRYMICSARRRQGKAGCSNNLWIPYNDFKAVIFSYISEALEEMVNIDEMVENHSIPLRSTQRVNFEKAKKKLEKKIQDHRKFLFEIRKQKMAGGMDEEQYDFEKEIYEKGIAEYQRQLQKLIEETKASSDLSGVKVEVKDALLKLTSLDYEDVDTVSILLKRLIDKIIIDQNGALEVYTPLGKIR
jgi:site-specific DNA recombinase